jgi:hypothetical protein
VRISVTALAATVIAASAAPAHSSDVGERGDLWLGLFADAPITLRLTVVGFSNYDREEHHSVDFAFLSIAGDLRRPSQRRGSLSLSFLLAPLTAMAAIAGMESGSEGKKIAGLAAAWLSGGTWRWTPGGRCNVGHGARSCASLALAVKHDLGIHPFVQPIYVRSTPGLGVAFRRVSWADPIPSGWTCGGGVGISAAAELQGRTSIDPVLWLSCLGGAD